MTLQVSYLNHASVVIETAGLRLLTDPWFAGSCFSGGWGLRFQNPDALEEATCATHLWISHWHSDHLHAPTLGALAERNPAMTVLANVSVNFSMVERLRAFGFSDVRPIYEREPLEIAPGVTATRFPTAGIDNALLLEAPDFRVLNYNDCNLPAKGIEWLRRNIGPIDLLLTNYNHAGKLFRRQAIADEKQGLWNVLRRTVELFEPKRVIPFASSHYYRTRETADQNPSLLTFNDLVQRSQHDPRFVILRVGDRVELAPKTLQPRIQAREPALQLASQELHDYGAAVDWNELTKVAQEHCERLAKGFPVSSRWAGRLVVQLSDLQRTLVLNCTPKHVAATEDPSASPHIEASSRALFDWMGRKFGADTFFAGAHFRIVDADTQAIERWGLFTLLEASALTERDVLRYAGSTGGVRFLWSRREEALATVLGGQVKAGQVRLG